MNRTLTRPIHRSEASTPDNDGMKSARPRPGHDLGDAVASVIAVGIAFLGVIGAAVLVCWAMYAVADLLGLLS